MSSGGRRRARTLPFNGCTNERGKQEVQLSLGGVTFVYTPHVSTHEERKSESEERHQENSVLTLLLAG